MGLWQKDEGQVVGGQGQGGDGLVVGEGQAGLESYLAWASPTWEAHSGELNLISCKTDNVTPSKFSANNIHFTFWDQLLEEW